jgi:hypothetical protein
MTAASAMAATRGATSADGTTAPTGVTTDVVPVTAGRRPDMVAPAPTPVVVAIGFIVVADISHPGVPVPVVAASAHADGAGSEYGERREQRCRCD